MKRVLSALKQRLLLAGYSTRYGRLAPPSYSRQQFEKVAKEALDLLEDGRKSLPPLPNGALQPYWSENLERLRKVLSSPLPERFLSIPTVQAAMVRRGWKKEQEHELAYLRTTPRLYERITREFVESRVGGPYLECRELACSSGTLGYFYYLARLLHFRQEHNLTRITERAVELGGGYGGLARVFLWAMAPRSYTIVDLPEYNALQYVYLKLSLPDQKVRMVSRPEDLSMSEEINLVPVNLLASDQLKLRADFFTSHFALTESGSWVRRAVYHRRFFDATEIYYAGQTSARWPVSVDPEVLRALAPELGWNVTTKPFYLDECVEIYATRSAPSTTESRKTPEAYLL